MNRSRKKAALSAAVASYVTRGLSVLIGFIVTPIILGFLGPTDYGIWAIVGSLLGYYGMFDLGIKGSASTLIAREQRDDSGVEISKIASNTLALHSVTGLLVLLTGIATVGLVVDRLGLAADTDSPIRLTLFLALAALAFSFPSQTLKAILRGTQQIASLRIIEFVGLLFRTAIVLGLLYAGFGLPALPLAGIVTGLIVTLMVLITTKRGVPRLQLKKRFVSKEGLSRVFGISMWWFVGSIGALLIYQVDNLVIGGTLGAAAVTPYVLTYRLSLLARQQIYQLNFILMPGVGDLVGRGDLKTLRKVFTLTFRITVGAAIVLASAILLFNKAFITLWVGSQNYSGDLVTGLFAIFLIVAVVFHSSSVVVTNFLQIRQMSTVRCLEGLVNLALSLVLIQSFGVVGVALATVLAAVVSSFWYAPWKAFRLLHLRGDALRANIILPIAKMTASVTLTTAVFWLWRPSGLVQVLAAGSLFMTISLAWVALFLLPRGQILMLARGEFNQLVEADLPGISDEMPRQNREL